MLQLTNFFNCTIKQKQIQLSICHLSVSHSAISQLVLEARRFNWRVAPPWQQLIKAPLFVNKFAAGCGVRARICISI